MSYKVVEQTTKILRKENDDLKEQLKYNKGEITNLEKAIDRILKAEANFLPHEMKE